MRKKSKVKAEFQPKKLIWILNRLSSTHKEWASRGLKNITLCKDQIILIIKLGFIIKILMKKITKMDKKLALNLSLSIKN